ncbi:MAG TPA: helix-turn-helix domain-containing protein [Micromonosporaceae bacterium]
MSRFHFSSVDLARTRLVPTLGPLTEVLFSLGVLSNPGNLHFGAWRAGLSSDRGVWAGPLGHLMAFPYFVDLFSFVTGASVDEGADRLAATSADRLRAEIEAGVELNATMGGRSARSWDSWVHQVPAERPMRDQVGQWLRAAHDTALQPHWQQIYTYLDDEYSTRSRILAHHGVERLLATLHPTLTWRPPVLEQPLGGDDVDYQLGGRGLIIVPSVFCQRPVMVRDPADEASPWVLFYPAVRDPLGAARLWTPAQPTDRALATLLGPGRATILQAIADGRSTTELARYAAVTPAAVSQHTSVLRNAGLIVTHRVGSSVLHTLTALGTALLEGRIRQPVDPVPDPAAQR